MPRWEIHNVDCLDFLRTLPDGSVDAVLVDPPFGVRDDAWDDMTPYEFARFSMAWIAEARRVAKEMVSFCVSDGPFRRICEMVYPRVRQAIWYKPPGSQYAGASEARLWFAHEDILHCHDKESWSSVKPKSLSLGRAIGDARREAGLSRGAVDIAVRGKRTGLCYRWEEGACIPTDEQVSTLKSVLPLNGAFETALADAKSMKVDVMREAAEKAAEKADVFVHRTITGGDHPCEKPVALMVEILDTIGKDWQTICDPFAGSGTTGVACIQTGRNFIGTEIDAGYCEIARRRCREAEEKIALTAGV